MPCESHLVCGLVIVTNLAAGGLGQMVKGQLFGSRHCQLCTVCGQYNACHKYGNSWLFPANSKPYVPRLVIVEAVGYENKALTVKSRCFFILIRKGALLWLM